MNKQQHQHNEHQSRRKDDQGSTPQSSRMDHQRNHDKSEGAREDGQTTAMQGRGAGFSRNAT